jgi:hypothetical protein
MVRKQGLVRKAMVIKKTRDITSCCWRQASTSCIHTLLEICIHTAQLRTATHTCAVNKLLACIASPECFSPFIRCKSSHSKDEKAEHLKGYWLKELSQGLSDSPKEGSFHHCVCVHAHGSQQEPGLSEDRLTTSPWLQLELDWTLSRQPPGSMFLCTLRPDWLTLHLCLCLVCCVFLSQMGACLIVYPLAQTPDTTQLSVCRGPQVRGSTQASVETTLETLVETGLFC